MTVISFFGVDLIFLADLWLSSRKAFEAVDTGTLFS